MRTHQQQQNERPAIRELTAMSEISCVACHWGTLTGAEFAAHASRCGQLKVLFAWLEKNSAAKARVLEKRAAELVEERRRLSETRRPVRPAPLVSPSVEPHSYPFRILPPGVLSLAHVADYYTRMERKHGREWAEARIDKSRFEFLESLLPRDRHVGKLGWDGYVVYEFAWSEKVILECAIVGNAAYVLWGDWLRKVQSTKAQLIEESATCQRVVHSGLWEQEIKNILGYGRSQGKR
jgi:hypothetical protein